jgi:methylated-DNA-[protein]-cysteine S-methyltransferase
MQNPEHASVTYCTFETALGVCGVAWGDAGVRRFQLPERDAAATAERVGRGLGLAHTGSPPQHVQRLIAAICRYAEGASVGFAEVALDLVETPPFHRAVYHAMRDVSWGQTTTYGALAAAAGSPGSARAVGQAMARNPWPLIVPCHRVLASGRRMGGFSAHGGTVTKQRLLMLEGVHLDVGTPLFPGFDTPGSEKVAH